MYGSLPLKDVEPQLPATPNKDDDDDDGMSLLEEPDQCLQESLLAKVSSFTLEYDPDRGYRATELDIFSFRRPHMRTFHGSWICFLMAWLLWFSMAPLLPHMKESMGQIDEEDIWISNIWSMVGTVFLRLVLGPLCDKWGARSLLTGLVIACAVPLGLAGILVHNNYTLIIIRFFIGCVGGTLVPAQYWITSHFVREVCGMAMAVVAGWGAMGGGLAQVLMGTVLFPWLEDQFNGDTNLAWRVAVLFPATLAIGVSIFFRCYSDDCPLGSYGQVQRAGLMQERSAIDSFRSGLFNVNAWILFIQFGASLGVELTVESSATSHLAKRFDLEIADAAAYASLFGLMNIFSRGLGGYISDRMFKEYSLRGRLIIHMIFGLCEGILIFYFMLCKSLNETLVAMVAFAIFGQMSMGTCFGIVPYVDGPNTGSIAGIVGAGGNVGAIFFLNVFRGRGDTAAFNTMAVFCIVASLITPLIKIKGFRGILFGSEGKLPPASLLIGASEVAPLSLSTKTSQFNSHRDA